MWRFIFFLSQLIDYNDRSKFWQQTQNGREGEEEERELCDPSREGLFSNYQPLGFTISSQKINSFQLLMKQTWFYAFPHFETAAECDFWSWKYFEVLKWVLSSIVLCLVIFTRSGFEIQSIFRGIVDQFASTLSPEFDDRSLQIWVGGCYGRCKERWSDL